MIMNGQQIGPFPIEQLQQHGLTRETYVWCEGMPDWKAAHEVPELDALLTHQAQQQQPNYYQQAQQAQRQQTTPGYNPTSYVHNIDPSQIERKFKTYSICFWLAFGIGVLGSILLITIGISQRFRDYEMGLGTMIVGLPVLTLGIIALVNRLSIIYHCWAAIQDGGRARTKPAEAIGFLFIPLFNIYWIFVAYKGLAEDMNNYQLMRNFNHRRVDEGLPLTFCVMSILGVIPYLGVLISLANVIISWMMTRRFADGLIHILHEKQMNA